MPSGANSHGPSHSCFSALEYAAGVCINGAMYISHLLHPAALLPYPPASIATVSEPHSEKVNGSAIQQPSVYHHQHSQSWPHFDSGAMARKPRIGNRRDRVPPLVCKSALPCISPVACGLEMKRVSPGFLFHMSANTAMSVGDWGPCH